MEAKRAIRSVLPGVLTLCMLGPAWAKEWRFAVMGDHRGDNKAFNETGDGYTDGGFNKLVLQDLGNALKDENVEFVLVVGDLVTKYNEKNLPNIDGDTLLSQELADWGETWNEASGYLPIFPVRGNQEVTASADTWRDFTASMPGIGTMRQDWPSREEGLTFSFKYKNALFLGVDQYASPEANGDTHVITPEAQEWIDQELSAPDKPFKFVFGHVPAYEVWDPKADEPFTAMKDGLASPYGELTPEFIDMRDAFWQSLGDAGAEYFCGHDHIFARGVAPDADGNLVRQTIIGTGGAPMPPPFPDEYDDLGPYAEAYAGIDLPTAPGEEPVNLESPLIISESLDEPNRFGYVVVEVQGSNATARYMAELAPGAGFDEVDSWGIIGTHGSYAALASAGNVSVPVPEPSTIALIALGLVCLVTRRPKNRELLCD